MGKDVQLSYHVQLPHHVGVDFAGLCFIFEGPVVFTVQETFRIKTNHFTAIRNVIEPITFHIGGRADSLQGPIMHSTRRQFGVRCLPKEFAVRFAKSHHHPTIASQLGIA